MNIECPFTSKEDLIYNQKTLKETCIHEEKYEYLFINSQNMSIPFPNFEQECDNLIQKLKRIIMKFKYPRTMHLPFSLGVGSDDKIKSSETYPSCKMGYHKIK